MGSRLSSWTLVFLLLAAAGAQAQTGVGAIAGTVKDGTGLVLPGANVEAAGPALIEKVRTVVSDGEGQYKIVALPPGTYTITVSLPGFNSIRREGIQLTTGFTATVNAELQVGDVAETITVSSASPVVDLQNTKQQAVMTRDIIDGIPTGHMYTMMAVLVPGMTYGLASGLIGQDVGGQSGQSKVALQIHGGRLGDQQLQVDGMSVEITSNGRQDATGNMLTQGNFQEYAIDYAASSAEIEGGGVRVNLIPREGGNALRGRLYVDGSSHTLQSNNLTPELRGRGLADSNRLKTQWSINPALGGAIKKDVLWFYATFTSQRNDIYAAGTYFTKDPAAWVYAPDLTRQAAEEQRTRDTAVRLTWQASRRNKFATYLNDDWYCRCYFNVGRGTTPEASIIFRNHQYIYQGTWTSPVTNRLLLEAGAADVPQPQNFLIEPIAVAPRITDSGLGVNFRAGNPGGPQYDTWSYRASATYVTGSHALKVGFTLTKLYFQSVSESLGHVNYTTVNGTPSQVIYRGDPVTSDNRANNLGIYAQEQWKLRRMTLNAGLRFDRLHSYYPEHNIAPTEYVPVARLIPRLDGTSWSDLSPRLGVSYDLFGNGRTALKASVNRYVLRSSTNTSLINPISNNNTNPRRWTDLNQDYVVQGDPFDPATNLELGPSTNLNFGKPIITARFDPEWSEGFGVRPYNWEISAGVQHELRSRVAINAAYYRRVYGNFGVTENIAVAPSDYSPFCVTAPADSRLPGGGSYPVCGLYDLNSSKVGSSFSLLSGASRYGDQSEGWSGVDLTLSARLAKALIQGGISTGKTTRDFCGIASSLPNVVATSVSGGGADSLTSGPNVSSDYCHVDYPFLTQAKVLGSYSLPWGVQLAGTYQNIPGPEIQANAVFTSAQVAPTLGRALASASNVTVNIVPPGTMYGDRVSQLDLRFSKRVTFAKARLEGMVDLYNALNASPVLVQNNTYGATIGAAAGAPWQVPQAILPGRTLKFSMQMDF